MGATMESAELGDAEELAGLRLRAYGPDADIAGDPVAQARLSQLEAARRPALTPESAASAGGILGDSEWADPGTEESPALMSIETSVHRDPVAVPAPAMSGARTWRERRPSIVSWAAVLAIGAIVVAGRVLPQSADATLDLRVEVSDALEAQLTAFGSLSYLGIVLDDVRLHEEFRGVNVWSAPTRHGTHCMFVTNASGKLWGVDCAPLGVEPIIDLTKYPHDGADIRGLDGLWGEMPTGSVIRLVLRGDFVDVLIHPAPDPSLRST